MTESECHRCNLDVIHIHSMVYSLKQAVMKQAEDESLWPETQTVVEEHLQLALQKLHMEILDIIGEVL